MPHLMLKLAAGRSAAQKAAIAEALTNAIESTANAADGRGRSAVAVQPEAGFVLGVALPVDGGFTAH